MKTLGFQLAVFAVALGLLIGDTCAQQAGPAKDLLGGASMLFSDPQDPPAQGGKLTLKDEPGDKVEDALALGNAARNRMPPDFASAEKAYRLAWKLDPGDPRPYIGLGNIYFDQERYPEAAKAYKKAIQLKETRSRRSSGFASKEFRTRDLTLDPAGQTGQWHVYLATTMLRQQNLAGAELELRLAVDSNPKNAKWVAQLGYTLLTQKRYTEASAFFETANTLDPNNSTFQKLFSLSSLKREKASAEDNAIARQLEGTIWKILDADTRIDNGACFLKSGQQLDCKLTGKKRMRYGGARWRIRDGLFELEQAGPLRPDLSLRPICVGERETDRIHLRCSALETESHEIWTRVH